jgi:pimeloyl-ACP methyl ester carboxylesterase
MKETDNLENFRAADLAELRARIAGDPEFALAARRWDCRLRLDVPGSPVLFDIKDGVLTALTPAPEGGDFDLRYGGSEGDWNQLLDAVPGPGFFFLPYDDRSSFHIEGDRARVLYPFYAAIQRIGTLLRELVHGTPEPVAVTRPPGQFSPIEGRYVYLTVGGQEFRIYFEEAGTGIPVLLHHTAGSDSRQWRHLLEDVELGRRFRFITYDLPFHGRSLPPTDVAWWEEPFRLTRAFAVEMARQFSAALTLDRPVFMGCSIGGHLAMDLAAECPEEFRALIGINGAIFTPNDPALVASWHDPRISDQWKGASMSAVMAPTGPENLRRETAWIYSQSAPDVFVGDIYYWAKDHDLRDTAATIDGTAHDVHLMIGEYDRVQQYDSRTPPTGPRELARQASGVKFQILPGLGHFAPSENPELFRTFLLPVLADIESREAEGR